MGSFLKSGPVVPVCYLDRRAGKSSQGHLESGEACWEAGGGQSGVWTPKRQILHKVQAIAEYAGIQAGPALSPLNCVWKRWHSYEVVQRALSGH